MNQSRSGRGGKRAGNNPELVQVVIAGSSQCSYVLSKRQFLVQDDPKCVANYLIIRVLRVSISLLFGLMLALSLLKPILLSPCSFKSELRLAYWSFVVLLEFS